METYFKILNNKLRNGGIKFMKHFSFKQMLSVGVLFFIAPMVTHAQETVDLEKENRIVLTTDSVEGRWQLLLLTGFLEPDDGRCWIDWNNDGEFQEDEKIICGFNIIEHDVSSPTITLYGQFKYLLCVRGGLSKVDFTKCPMITTINLQRNNLKEIDLSRQEDLHYLFLGVNQLSSVKIQKEWTGLCMVELFSNNISEKEMQNIADEIVDFSTFPDGTTGEICVVDGRPEVEHNVCTKATVETFKSKKWDVKYYPNYDDPDCTSEDYEGSTTGIKLVRNNEPEISLNGNMLTVTGLKCGEAVEVLDLNGHRMALAGAVGNVVNVPLNGLSDGCYIVKAGMKTKKFILNR